MEKYLYVVNPVAGKGGGRKVIPLIEDFCKKKAIKFIPYSKQSDKNTVEIVRTNINDFSTIISVGGDGTLNEIINGFGIGSGTKLAVLPVGSGNDFVKNIGLNGKIKDDLSIIHNEKLNEIIRADIGIVEYKTEGQADILKHMFINNLGIGFDAYVGYINQTNKVFSGLISYIYAVFKALANYRMISTEIKIDDATIIGERLMISIGNGISSGGGFYLNPNAIVDDGILDISVFDKITRRRLLTALPMALLNKLEKVPEAKLFRTNNRVEIELKNPYYMHCDGEIVTERLSMAKVTICKEAIKVIKRLGM